MRTLIVIVVALALLVAAAIALAPASLVAPPLAAASADHITIADTQGTIWNGRATVVGDDGTRIPFQWNTEAAALVRRELHLRIAPHANATTPHADIEWNHGELHARDVALSVPAAWLASTLKRSVSVDLGGEVSVTSASFDWTPASARGEVRVDWHDARLAAPAVPSIDLGDVTASLRGDGNRLTGPVANQGGDLAIDGDIVARIDGGGEANLLLAPRRIDERISSALAVIATPEAGAYRVRVRWPGR